MDLYETRKGYLLACTFSDILLYLTSIFCTHKFKPIFVCSYVVIFIHQGTCNITIILPFQYADFLQLFFSIWGMVLLWHFLSEVCYFVPAPVLSVSFISIHILHNLIFTSHIMYLFQGTPANMHRRICIRGRISWGNQETAVKEKYLPLIYHSNAQAIESAYFLITCCPIICKEPIIDRHMCSLPCLCSVQLPESGIGMHQDNSDRSYIQG